MNQETVIFSDTYEIRQSLSKRRADQSRTHCIENFAECTEKSVNTHKFRKTLYADDRTERAAGSQALQQEG